MESKSELKGELTDIKAQLERIVENNAKESELLEKKNSAEETSSNLLSLVKFVIDENRKTTMLLRNLSNTVSQLAGSLQAEQGEEQDLPEQLDELPISELDAKILQHIQVKGMACAEDIRSLMNYKGRNAACARLSELHRRGILQRYQLGHKVYYKYDAGKATNTLIVSPPH